MVNRVLNISEATVIGLHAVVLLANSDGLKLTVSRISKLLNVSRAHLAKVMQQLARTGILKASLGPAGGYTLSKPASKITLLDVYQAIDGPFIPKKCLFEKPICRNKKCIMGPLVKQINAEVYEYLRNTKISEVADIFEKVAK